MSFLLRGTSFAQMCCTEWGYVQENRSFIAQDRHYLSHALYLSVHVSVLLYSLVSFYHEKAEDSKDHSSANRHYCGNDDVVVVFCTYKQTECIRAIYSYLYCINTVYPVSKLQNKGHPWNLAEWNHLTFYIELQCCWGRLSSVKFCCAGDLTMVILLLRNERQDGQHPQLASMKFSVHLSDLICCATTPGECRTMGGAGVGDWTGDSVGMILNGFLWRSQSRFRGISYKWKS